MTRIREALGRRVVARDTAEEIGRVTELIVGRDARITAVTTGPFELVPVVGGPMVGGPGWATGMGAVGFTLPAPRIVLDWSSIVGFGPDAVVAATESSVREPASDAELAAISGGGLLDRPRMTDAGDIVGSIADVEFDADTGRTTGFVIGDRVVPLTRLVAIGPFAVIMTAPETPSQGPGN